MTSVKELESRRTRDRGFTLVEMLVGILVCGILIAAIAAAFSVFIRTSDVTSQRFYESADALLAGAYLATDVETGAHITAGGCGGAAGETRLIGLENEDASVIGYYSSSAGGTVTRRRCTSAGSVSSTRVVVRAALGIDPAVVM